MRAALFLVCALMMSACITYQKCVDKFGTLATDSIPTRASLALDTTLMGFVMEDSVTGYLSLDSLCDAWSKISYQLKDSLNDQAKTWYALSESGKLSTAHWIDKYNRLLRFKSKKEIDTVYVHLRDTVYRDVKCPPVVTFDKSKGSRLWALWEGYQFFAAWALLVLLLVLVFLKQIKKVFA